MRDPEASAAIFVDFSIAVMFGPFSRATARDEPVVLAVQPLPGSRATVTVVSVELMIFSHRTCLTFAVEEVPVALLITVNLEFKVTVFTLNTPLKPAFAAPVIVTSSPTCISPVCATL